VKKLGVESIHIFYNDFKKLTEISFDSSDYEIKSTSNILRKLLLDNINLNNIWHTLGNDDKIHLNDVTLEGELNNENKIASKIYIPFLNVIPNNVINHYLVINSNAIIKDEVLSIPKYPILILNRSKIGKYMSGKIIIDGNYFTRKDILEFVCYLQGYIHLNLDEYKIKTLKLVENLRFEHAVDNISSIKLTIYNTNTVTSQPNELISLGEKHHFETLILLQIIKDLTCSLDVIKLYNQSKVYLKENLKHFEHISNGEINLIYDSNGTERGEKWIEYNSYK